MGVPAEKQCWASCSISKPLNSPSHMRSSSHTPRCRPGSSLQEGALAALRHHHRANLCAHLPPDHLLPALLLACAKVRAHLPSGTSGGPWFLTHHVWLTRIPRSSSALAAFSPHFSPVLDTVPFGWPKPRGMRQGTRGVWRGGCNAEIAWRGHMGITLEGQEREVHSLKRKKSAFLISAAGGTTFY